MYLTTEQRYNIAMRMLGIVEHMAFGREKQVEPLSTPMAPQSEQEDDALNEMIRAQLNAAGANFMASADGEVDEQ